VGERSRNGGIVQFSSRQFADVVVVAPAGRIGHGTAGERARAPTPPLPQSTLSAPGLAALNAA